MNKEIISALEKNSFLPPREIWTKTDPRGEEYGIWQIRPESKFPFVCSARYVPDYPEGGEFTLWFTCTADFVNWLSNEF